MDRDLLDVLAENIGCTCLSDMKYLNKRSGLPKKAIDCIESEIYSVEQWTQAVAYITGDDNISFTSESEARIFLTAGQQGK